MREIYLNSFKKEKTEQIPIWIMRQAGRYLPEYRKVRANFPNFMNMCKNAEACAEVALQPIRRYDLDTSIVFSDILTIPESLGLPLEFKTGIGPVFSKKITSEKDVNILADIDGAINKLDYVFNAVKVTKSHLDIPLIGFSGSPWTLATYMVEGQGSKQFLHLRKMMYSQPQTLHKLLKKLTDISIVYLSKQVENGADSLMIFDSWGGVLSPHKYIEFSLNYMQQIINGVKAKHSHIPMTIFTKGGANFIPSMATTLANGLGIDWSIDLAKARALSGDNITLQGNLDPAALYGTRESIKLEVSKIMCTIKADEKNNYIFNLGHGIYPDIDPNNVQCMIDAVREF